MAFKTPGVFVKERRVFGRTINTNDTAVPVFIGYTQMPIKTTAAPNKSSPNVLEDKPEKPKLNDTDIEPTTRRINSLREFVNEFGGGYYHLKEEEKKFFFLYESIKLYFANGGGTCFIVSIGDYSAKKVNAKDLIKGLEELIKIPQANLAVVPDAVSLKSKEKGSFYEELLKCCTPDIDNKGFVNKFAVLDAGTVEEQVKKYADEKALSLIADGDHLFYGAMYHPWVETTVVTRKDIEDGLLSDDNLATFSKDFGVSATELKKISTVRQRARYVSREKKKEWEDLVDNLIEKSSQLPPSGAIAGAFVRSDTQFGIQKAPANISLHKVSQLHSTITDFTQRAFNAPENGKAINCIRSKVNNGIKIWGARTLDCNDLDFRYVNVRRTMSMLEESIKSLLENFVFDDNTERTWLKIRATLSSFLKKMLTRGVLYGTTPSQAFEFSVGLGQTMDQSDILNGIIRVEVKVALIRPAEFIEIIFEQKSMEGGTANVESENGASLN